MCYLNLTLRTKVPIPPTSKDENKNSSLVRNDGMETQTKLVKKV